MKKLALVLLAVATVFSMVACKSSGATSAEKEQAAKNKALKKIYASYYDALVLDGAETYTVKSGDRLTAISKDFYGDGNGYFFPLIMLASNETVQDPELIEPGMELVVPNFDANINDSSVATKLKPYFKEIAEFYKSDKASAAYADEMYEQLMDISNKLGEETFATVSASTVETESEEE